MHAQGDRRGRSAKKWAAIVAAAVVALGLAYTIDLPSQSPSPSPSPSLFLSPSSSPTPTGTSSASDSEDALTVGEGGRYPTIQAAVDAAVPGDTVQIAGGTYREVVNFRKSGSPGAFITVKAKNGEKVIVDGSGVLPAISTAARGLLTLDRRQYIKISGLTVTRSNRHGIYAGHASNIVVENSEISYARDGGILVGNGSDVTIDNNRVHHNNAAAESGDIERSANEGVTLFQVTGFEIKNNTVFENEEEGIDVKNGARDGAVHDNNVYRNNGPNIYIDGANDVRVYNNNVHDAKGQTKSGIGLAVESGGSARNVSIFNNVIHGNPGGGVDFWIGRYEDVQIVNNTIYDNGKTAISARDGTVSDSAAINNIAYGNALKSVAGIAMEHNLTSDPDFVDVAKDDVRLKAGSAAIDTASAAKAPAFDFTGGARPVGSGPDIGAYEYGATRSTP